MIRFLLLGLLWFLYSGVSVAAVQELIVASDGTGQYRTVQEAVDAIPVNNPTHVVVRVKPGIYKGHVRVPRDKPHITFLGENAEKTVLTNDWYSSLKKPDGTTYGTSGSASVLIEGDDFTAENITFENSAGKTVGQAVAIRVMSDRCVFRKCRFLGWQDTLYANGKGRQYYRDCHIEGHVDFIFGSAAAVFENCTILSKSPGYVTAQSRTEPDAPLGYVFQNCTFTASDTRPGSVHLGRPWRPYARVVLLNCRLREHIRPEGWDNWRNPANESTAWYAEYNSAGPGASPSTRVTWSRQLTREEAESFDTLRFLARSDNWNPR